MTSPMQASLSAIGQRLRAEYFPAVGRPLPPELEDLVGRAVNQCPAQAISLSDD